MLSRKRQRFAAVFLPGETAGEGLRCVKCVTGVRGLSGPLPRRLQRQTSGSAPRTPASSKVVRPRWNASVPKWPPQRTSARPALSGSSASYLAPFRACQPGPDLGAERTESQALDADPLAANHCHWLQNAAGTFGKNPRFSKLACTFYGAWFGKRLNCTTSFTPQVRKCLRCFTLWVLLRTCPTFLLDTGRSLWPTDS